MEFTDINLERMIRVIVGLFVIKATGFSILRYRGGPDGLAAHYLIQRLSIFSAWVTSFAIKRCTEVFDLHLYGRNRVQICTFLQTPNSTHCLFGPYDLYIMHILHILHVSHTLLIQSLNLWTGSVFFSRRVTYCGMSAETGPVVF